MSRSSETSDRSTSDSNSGHDSSRMLRSLFLLLVLSQGQEVPLRRERPRRGDRGVGMGDRQQRVRDAERGLRDDHRVALVGLGVAAEQPGGLVGGQARQVRRRHSRRPRAGERERADVADLVDDDEGSGELGEKRVEGVFPVGYGLAREHLAVARRDARPVRRLPDVEPYDDFRPSRWCHGGILPIVRPIGSPPCDTHITWPWRPRPAVSYQSFGAASASGGNTPRALFGAGADGHPEAPDRRPLGACPYRRQCAECSPPKFIDGLSQTVMGRAESANA